MTADALTMKTKVLQILDELPLERVAEVLDFVSFLNMRRRTEVGSVMVPNLPTVPATRLMSLSGLVAWGGDAVADTEGLYDGE